MKRIVIFLCLWCATSEASLAQTHLGAPPPSSPWTPPRVHFSLDGLVFDLTYQRWAFGPLSEPVADCSNANFYCITSATFGLALPKRCADLGAGPWAADSVRTEVLHREVAPPPPHGGGSGITMYLGDPSRPGQLFEYDPSLGLTGIYWDPAGRTDFVAMARSREIASWLSTRRDAERGRRYFPRTSLSTVGICR